MQILTKNAVLVCAHETGIVGIVNTQTLVKVAGVEVLVEIDPEARPIVGCPNYNPPAGIKPCLLTLKVQEGYSNLLTIDGRRVCLDTVTGYTDGTPPGTHKYKVRSPGQVFVRQA